LENPVSERWRFPTASSTPCPRPQSSELFYAITRGYHSSPVVGFPYLAIPRDDSSLNLAHRHHRLLLTAGAMTDQYDECPQHKALFPSLPVLVRSPNGFLALRSHRHPLLINCGPHTEHSPPPPEPHTQSPRPPQS